MSNIGNPVSQMQRQSSAAADDSVDRTPVATPPPEPGLLALSRGVVIIRWAVLAWMAVLVASGAAGFPGAVAGWTAVAATAGWTLWLTLARPPPTTAVLGTDLGVAMILVVLGARFPGFATVYPVTTALSWGAARGLPGGIAAGAVLAATSVVARLTGAAPLDGQGAQQLVAVGRDPVYFVLAGGGTGFVATLLERSAAQVRTAQAAQMRERERAARLTEREVLGRQIHDSVLQVLAMVHKRGRELAQSEPVPASEVARLADLAAAQERTLRTLILRAPDDMDGVTSQALLRSALEAAAEPVRGTLDITVSVVDDVTLPASHVHEIQAAVEQALANVIRHAQARRVWILSEVDSGDVVVTVRDDGRGFEFDVGRLRAAGKFGLLRSIGGRVEQLGGTLRVDTAPGRGTEIELRVPHPAAEEPSP